MTDFQSFALPDALRRALAAMQFVTPTPIQAKAIPIALEGKDVLGSAQTGTGKTAAFGIPMVARLLTNPRGTALVLTPTRELAAQVMTVLTDLLGKGSPIRTALLIGGESMPKQIQQLKMRPRVIVGTPGRINDHLERGSLMLHDANYLVLDETDRMLDMGFSVQLDRIFKFLPQQRQTLMFSATLPPAIVKLSEKYLRSPERVSVGATNVTATAVKQEQIHLPQASKYEELVKQLSTREGSIIVFVKTKFGAEKLADKLSRHKHSADALHGDLQQHKRNRIIAAFRDKQYRVMVATDIAARGLDIPHIEHVINYDLPQSPEDYIHRIGRTARAGAEGSALSFISPEDHDKWRAIHRMLNPGEKQQHEPRRPGQPGGKSGGGKSFRFGRRRRRGGAPRQAA